MKTLIFATLSTTLVAGALSLATKYSPDHPLRCDVTMTVSSETTMEATRDGQPVRFLWNSAPGCSVKPTIS